MDNKGRLKVFITGITGQLGHNCVREIIRREETTVGSGSRSIEKLDMRVLISGVNGQFDQDATNDLTERVCGSVGSDIATNSIIVQANTIFDNFSYVQLDITDQKDVKKVIEREHPDAIIHCAAWTDVDEAEDNKEKVNAVNHLGTQYLAEAAKAVDAKMVYISTDYVFDGSGDRPWQPDDNSYAPLNVYGQSKLDGELAVANTLEKYFIVRTSWVFGLNGNNFVKTMVNAGRKHDTVRVVNDQIGRPTYSKDLARLLVDMVETDKYGYYHATNEGDNISWYDFTKEIYRQAGLSTTVIPVSTAEYGLSKAKRPFNSRLVTSKLAESGFKPLPDWKDALSRYLAEAKL